MSKPLRILYASGPGNVIRTYNYWIKGQDNPSEVSVTFSSQFFEVCRALCAEGHCSKLQMQKMFNQAHVVIVPTKTEFVEGLNRVVIEGVLSGRPVITSAVCPALSYVRDAVVEVPPDDVKAYGDALIKLCDDQKFYEQKQRNCLGLQQQFYDTSHSWGTALKSVLVSS